MIISGAIYSQVGINTSNPQDTFHVDGGKDNDATGAPTLGQQGNDVIITSAGNIGVGTVNPAARVEINNGSISGAIKIVDGSQADGKILTSDANGVGMWKETKPRVVQGVTPNPAMSISSDGNSTVKYTGMYIDLPQGKWIIHLGLLFTANVSNTKFLLHTYFSSSTTARQFYGFDFFSPTGGGTNIAGTLTNNGSGVLESNYDFVNGSSLVNVTSSSVRLYVLIANKPSNYWNMWTASYEDYFYATPVN